MIEALNRTLEVHQRLLPKDAAASAPAPLPPAGPNGEANVAPKEFKLFGEDGFTFRDAIDIINPLQHIPIVSTIYRRLTGDELSPGARVAGATLFGGPIGAAIALADTAVEYETGHDIGENALAMIIGDDKPDTGGTAVAAADKTPRDATALATVKSGGTAVAGFAATPDLGALGGFATSGGTSAPTVTPFQLEPRYDIEPWTPPPALEAAPASVAETAARPEPGSPAATVTPPPTTPMPAVPGVIALAEPRAPAEPPTDTPARPMPSQAAVSQAINALAQMPTSQTTAAVAQLASTNPRPLPRHYMAPPAGDIPRGAAGTLSRAATRAYVTSMAAAGQTATVADTDSTATTAVTRATEKAQNDWIVDAMQEAMAKYEASARLRATGVDSAPSVAVSR